MSLLICLISIKLYSLYLPFREKGDDFLQETTQWQLFLVLLSAILVKVDNEDESAADQMYLGYLLIAIVIPGYLITPWQCFSEYRNWDGVEPSGAV